MALQFPPRAGYAFDADDGGLLTKLGVAEPLVGLDPTGAPVPGLAASWSQAPDGRTWRFALREGVVFHDGAPLDANAVVTALRHVLGRPTPPRPIDGIGLQVAAEGPGTVFPNRPELPVLASAIAAQLGAVGVGVDITVGEYASQEPEVLAGRYDMFLNSRSYLSDFPDPAGVLASDYGCGGSYAIDRYCSPAFDAIVGRLGGLTDPAARAAGFREAATQLVTDAVGVPIVHPRNTAAERGVSGFRPDPLDLRPVLPALAPASD